MKDNNTEIPKYAGFAALFLGLSIILLLELVMRWFGM